MVSGQVLLGIEMPGPARQKIRFGEFEVDPHTQELHRQGRRVKLSPQAFRVLEFLAGRPGQLVTREEIQQQVWNPVTFVDFEHGINKSIRQIRTALGDDADLPKFVETLPRRGYRFIAAVTLPEEALAEEAAPVVPPAEPGPEPKPALSPPWRPRKSAGIFLAAATALLVATILLGRYAGSRVRAPATGPIQSLAVLPLENLSGDPSQDYFAAGITEELITDLAKLGAVRVISHTSVMQYRHVKQALPEIGRELHVDAVVEGGVLRSGDRVRITAQLIRAATDEHLWAETYERNVRDILALQDEVAQDIAREIKIKVAELSHGSTRPPRLVVPEAYDDYLMGRFEWNKRTPVSLNRALELFQQAVAKDSTYARAYAGLASAYAILGAAGYDSLLVSDALEKAKATALKAIEIDDSLSEAHSSLAFVAYSFGWSWHEAENEFKRALDLNPNNATAHQWYSEYLCTRGRWEASIAEAEAALALDPHSSIIQENLARPYYYSRRLDEAINYSRKTLQTEASFAISHLRLGRAYAAKGMYQDAAGEFQRFSDLVGGSTLATASLANVRARAGDRKTALRLAAELTLLSARKHVPAYQFAIVYVGLGETDRTVEWLEEAYRERSDFLLYLKHEPMFDGLKSDLRFRDLERRIDMGARPNDLSSIISTSDN